MIKRIIQQVKTGEPVSRQDAAMLFLEASDEDLRHLATTARNLRHPANQATYVIMAIINYTNVCVAKCDYCAFYRLPHQEGTYLLSPQQIFDRIDRVVGYGGTLVGFNGGFHPKLRIQDYADLFSKIRSRFGEKIEFYGMTVAEFIFACKVSKMDYAEGAKILKDHGSRWITGGGAEIMDDAFRKRHSPGKSTVEEFFKAQRAVLEGGLGSTATMVIGFDESLDERFNHLDALRTFQDSVVRKLPSFLCWTYKPFHTELGGEEVSIREYLRWLAICRIYLQNFEHIRSSVLTRNEEALLGLRYGANDFDLPTEDEVTQKAGATISLDFEKILNTARNHGFTPIHRTPFSVS